MRGLKSRFTGKALGLGFILSLIAVPNLTAASELNSVNLDLHRVEDSLEDWGIDLLADFDGTRGKCWLDTGASLSTVRNS